MSAERFRLGLVVGKFAPLHLGHLQLIDAAAARCERVLVLSWCKPEPEHCEAAARERWLRACRPWHEIVVLDDTALAEACQARGVAARPLPPDASDDATQQHFLAWLLAEVLQRQPDAMFASEAYLQPCAAVLSAHFGRPIAPVMVDAARRAVPISARQIRKAPMAHRAFVPDAVWPDWVPRIALLGGESSGKSTLAQALAQRHGAACVAEYGRELWERQQGRLQEPDLLHIAQEQVRREQEAASGAYPFLACDTTPLTTLFYALDLFGRADPRLIDLAGRRYHLTVLCAPDFPFVQDGTRREPGFREHQHAWYRAQLAARHWPFLEVQGPLAQRLQQVAEALRPA